MDLFGSKEPARLRCQFHYNRCMTGRQKAAATFLVLGILLSVAAVTLNITWIITNWRNGWQMVIGVIFFALIIAGLITYTVFLVREIRRNEQQDSFLHAVTHELKTPIASIRLYLETLQSRDVDDVKRAEFYRVMLADTDRLNNTVEQVLRAGYDGAGQKPSRTRLELDALVCECAELARKRHHLEETSLSVKLPSRPVMVLGDSEELHSAVVNLLDNAVKYSGEQVHVKVDVVSMDGKAQVRVIDEGSGIPATELKKVFDRFYRVSARSTREVGGTGLGLYLVKNIAKRHGGKVFAESAGEGKGSVFTLELPVSS